MTSQNEIYCFLKENTPIAFSQDGLEIALKTKSKITTQLRQLVILKDICTLERINPYTNRIKKYYCYGWKK